MTHHGDHRAQKDARECDDRDLRYFGDPGTAKDQAINKTEKGAVSKSRAEQPADHDAKKNSDGKL